MKSRGIFIVGCPRSGTTLLQSILSSHRNIYTAPETSFFSRIIPKLGVEYSNPEKQIDTHGLEVIASDFEEMTGLALPDEYLDQNTGISIRLAFENLLNAFNSSGKPVWVEKTTLHARNLGLIRRFYPDARIIHVIRDPVACVGSMMSIKPVSAGDMRISYLKSLYSHSRLWTECVSSVLVFPAQENVLHIQYESLISYPEEVVAGICEFIGEPFEQGMLTSFHESASDLFSESYTPWQKKNLSPGISNKSLYKWRETLGSNKTRLIQLYTRHYSMMMGYYEELPRSSAITVILLYAVDQVLRFISATKFEMFIRKLVVRPAK